MLFNNDDIGQLRYFVDIAETLNTIYRYLLDHPDYQFKIDNIYIERDGFFNKLKKNCSYVDNIFKSVASSDPDKFIYGQLTDINQELMLAYKDLLVERNRVRLFFNSIVLLFYRFFEKILENKFFPSPLNIKYSTANYFEDYVSELKALVNKILSNDSEFSDNHEYKFFILDNKIKDLFEKLVESKNDFERRFEKLKENNDIVNSSTFQKELDNFFSKQREAFERKSNEVIGDFNLKLQYIENECVNNLPEKIQSLQDIINNSKNEVDNLDNAIESYKSTVSTKIQNEISKHYQKKAKMEMYTYWGATSFSIILILSSLGLLAWGLVDYYHDYISTNICLKDEAFNACVSRLEKVRDITKNIGITFFVMRFSFSLLLFLTVIYTSRIAIRAYSHWRHSENMHLKLSSLEPFITELPKEVRHEIHRELIPDYFGKDAGLVDTANEKFKDLPANISAVAMKAIEQISGGGSNSSTEKNGKKSDDETG